MQPRESLTVVGTMTGTSMDGIDVDLMITDGDQQVNEVGHFSLSYTDNCKIILKAAEFAIRKRMGVMEAARAYYPQAIRDYLIREVNVSEMEVDSKLEELSAYLYGTESVHSAITLDDVIRHSTDLHAIAVKKLLEEMGYVASEIDVVGYHGQTMFHKPSIGKSVIVGDGQALADQLGITVVNDFRSNDVAAGGQGAPFAPLYHQALAKRDGKIPMAVVNCGGIANITLIKNENPLDLIAYDVGPGNGLIDKLVKQRTSNKENMDANGYYGLRGKVHEHLLDVLYEKSIIREGQSYFSMPPPKSLDIGDMQLIEELNPLSLEDACATLEAFTAYTIIKSLESLNVKLSRQWVLAGGGWNNPVIRRELDSRLKQLLNQQVDIRTADEMGWNSQGLEAQIFAYLAVRSLNNEPLSVPGTTRVPKPLSGGHAYVPTQQEPTQKVKKLLDVNPAVLSGYREETISKKEFVMA